MPSGASGVRNPACVSHKGGRLTSLKDHRSQISSDHLALTDKSSKYVTESALVQTPIFPASLNVPSVAWINCLPSKEHVNRLPTQVRLNSCHWPLVTVVLAPANCTRLPFTT